MNFNQISATTACYLSIGLTAIFLASGCSKSSEDLPPRAAVHGTVTLDGKPLLQGVIRFIPQGDVSGFKSFATISNGTFDIDQLHGPVACLNRIEIESTDDGGFAADDESGFARLKAAKAKKINVTRVPSNYNTRSSLTQQLLAETTNELTFNLSSKRTRSRRRTK